MKLKSKYLLSLPVAMLPMLYNCSSVVATGISGVQVNGGKISVDVGNAGTTSNVKTMSDFWNKIFSIGKMLIFGITGVLAMAMIVVFAVKAFNLSAAGDNPKKRQEAIEGMLFAVIGAALLGGASMISGLAFGLFR